MAKNKYADMFTLRKDGRYQASYTDDTGRHYLYDRDPERLWQKLQSTDDPEEHEPTFGELAKAWEREHREEITNRTWNNYRPHYEAIIARHGSCSAAEVSAQAVLNHLLEAKAKGYSATVVNSIRSLYRMIFDYAIIHGYAQFNPVTSVRLPRGLKRGKRRAPTKEQMQIILSSLDKPFGLFAYLLLCTGLRKSEALALTWADVDFKKKLISITKTLDYTDTVHPSLKPPKTEAGVRDVPILNILTEPLRTARQSSKSDLLFPAPPSSRGGGGGGYMSLRSYEGAWQRYCQAAGLADKDGSPLLTAHNLRHGTATLMFELGVDELTTQRLLGHSRIEITREIYTDLRAEKQKSSLTKLNRGMSKMMSSSKK